jgi:hypothetical protein
MSPWQLAKSGTEHSEQVALFSWLSIAANYGFRVAWDERAYKEKGWAASHGADVANAALHWAFAIPNGGSRGGTKDQAMRVGSQLKAEGVKSGVSDIFVPIPKHGLHGLFIEMKKLDGGSGLSPNQKAFGDFARKQGYGFCQCNGWEAAAKVIELWLSE